MTDVRGGNGGPRVGRRRSPAFNLLIVAAALVLVGASATTGAWWFRGGAFLHAAGAGYGGIVHTNEQYSIGVDLTTASGSSVVLDRVTASSSDDLRVEWSIYRTEPGGLGFGSWHGPLGARWPTSAVHGYRVAQPDWHPERGATWLVASVTASHPGVYRLSNISIKYRSGRRNRSRAGGASLCVLMASATDYQRLLHQVTNFEQNVTDLGSVDPLVAEFEQCSDPSLSP